MSKPAPTFVLVGHCGPDAAMLGSAVRRAVPGADVVTVMDSASLARHLTPARVLLVNRQLDGDFGQQSAGVELIREVRQPTGAPTVMLVSNMADAQREAVEAGALPGFGKTALYDAATAQRLREAAAVASAGARAATEEGNTHARTNDKT